MVSEDSSVAAEPGLALPTLFIAPACSVRRLDDTAVFKLCCVLAGALSSPAVRLRRRRTMEMSGQGSGHPRHRSRRIVSNCIDARLQLFEDPMLQSI
jgi:hypothetical protein